MNDATPSPPADRPQPRGVTLHIGIAERGKMYALAGDHTRALHYYRTAMRLAVEARDPEVFFRHYLECVMESLEQMGALDEVLAYCDRAIALYAETPPPNPVAVMDLACIHLKRGVILLKKREAAAARGSLKEAVEIARRANARLELAQTLLRWVDAGFDVTPQRVVSEQARARYWSVRREAVDPMRAIEMAGEGSGPTTPFR